MKKNKGFTLIELLAVIVILGVVVMIAVPSVSDVIQNTRKEAYVSLVNIYTDEVRKQIASKKIILKQDGSTYYIPVDVIDLDTGTNDNSPFGPWATIDTKVRYLAYDDDEVLTCAGVSSPSVTTSGSVPGFKIYNNKLAEYDFNGKVFNKVTQGCIPANTIHEAYVIVRYDKNKSEYVYSWASRDVTGHTILFEDVETINSDDIIVNKRPILTFEETTKNAVNSDTGANVRTFNYDEVTARSGFANARVNLYLRDKDLSGGSASLKMTGEEARRCFVYYFVTPTTIGIEDYNEKECGTRVEVPSEIDGFTVVEIGAYAFYNKGIVSVIIYDGIQTIGSSAFRNNHISELYLPNTPISIGSWAFYSNDLTEINLPKNTTATGGAFSGNNIPEDRAFIYRMLSDGTKDYSYLSGYAGTSKDIVIPPSVNGVPLKTIGSSAFRSLSLNSISVPNSVETIESWALAGNNFTTFTWPSNIKSIGGAAFVNCKLTSLNIPSSVTYIGTRAFNGCTVSSSDPDVFVYARSASGINYSNIVSYAGSNKNITIPPSKNGVALKTISGSAFLATGLKSINGGIPNSVTSIGVEAFNANSTSGSDDQFIYGRGTSGGYDYTKLVGYAGSNRAHVTIPATKNGVALKTIVNQAFGECSVKKVTIPEGVTSIESNAFRYNYLTEVTIPSTVTSIGARAFCDEVSWGKFNRLTKIVNKTNKQFDWASITCSKEAANFSTGTINHQLGAISVVSN